MEVRDKGENERREKKENGGESEKEMEMRENEGDKGERKKRMEGRVRRKWR